MTCEKLLKSLNSIVTQVNQMKADLDQRIEKEIQSYNLFTPTKEQDEADVELSPCKVNKLTVTSKNHNSRLHEMKKKKNN